MNTPDPAPWCDHCGREVGPVDHSACARARAYEPPRYCARCRRRLVVQVLPDCWRATCVHHGQLSGPERYSA